MATNIYESPTLREATEQRTQAYETLHEQLVSLKKEFGKIVNDSEFQGHGAEAIKGFYGAQCDVVDAWLRLIDMTIEFFKSIPGYMEDAELAGSSTVHIPYLEQNVERGIKTAKDQVASQQEALQSIIKSINDLVPLTVFSGDEFDLKMNAAEKKRNLTVEKVHALDQNLTKEYKALQVQADQVSLLYTEMMNATRQGEHISPLLFNAEAYKTSEVYKLQSELTILAAGYVEQKKAERQAREVKATEKSEVKSVTKGKGLFESVGDGVWDGAGNAIGDTVDGVVDMVKNPEGVVDGVKYVWNNPKEAAQGVWDQTTASWNEKVINGNAETRSEFFTYMGTNIAVGALGSKGIDKVAKASKLTKADIAAETNDIKYVVKKNSASYLDKINQLGRAFIPHQQVATAGGMYFRMKDIGDVEKRDTIYQASNVDPVENNKSYNKGDKSILAPGGGLIAHELKGGHLIERHIGKSDEELLNRLKSNPKIMGSSTFKDRETAEKVVHIVLNNPANIIKIEKWLANRNSKPTLPLRFRGDGQIIGRSVSRHSGVVENVTNAKIILKKDSNGNYVLTGYPEK
ncbi:T7SS effector LXG polymorphic toxin [Fictibacillus iocasae]|uniref:T7SS effector LXG polymorphic toxin n=1 Tax=Fictibacillus iocasae TaxID=2715437 RepID=A0ABW2NN83_9BACL